MTATPDNTMVVSPQMIHELRNTLLRGTVHEWWSVVKTEIEIRTALIMFTESRQELVNK